MGGGDSGPDGSGGGWLRGGRGSRSSDRNASAGTPDYRDSGVEWLGEIPAHWDMKRLKFVSHIVAGQSPPSEAVVDSMDGLSFLQGNAEFGPMNPTPHQVCDSAPKRAEPGDILLSVRAPVGAMNMADRHYGIGRGLCAIRPTAGLGRLFSFYEVMTMRPLLDAVATGSTYDAVTASDVGDLPMLLPGRDEQRAIAAFLERETVKIDALVAKKERLIELLQEKRTALITRAVTQGLDPNVPMKDSGVEWLGEIPHHWTAGALSRWWTVLDCKHRTVQFRDDGIAVASIGEVHGLKVDLTSANRTSLEEYRRMIEGGREPQAGDIVYSRNATVGEAAIVDNDEPFCMGQDVSLIRSTAGQPLFLLHTLRSRVVLAQLEALMVGSTFKRINVGQIKKFFVPVPPRAEQEDIAHYGQDVYRRIDLLIERVRVAINHLTEYRTALISAAVTGKIDVRDEAA